MNNCEICGRRETALWDIALRTGDRALLCETCGDDLNHLTSVVSAMITDDIKTIAIKISREAARLAHARVNLIAKGGEA